MTRPDVEIVNGEPVYPEPPTPPPSTTGTPGPPPLGYLDVIADELLAGFERTEEQATNAKLVAGSVADALTENGWCITAQVSSSTTGTVLGEEVRRPVRLTLPATRVGGERVYVEWSVQWTPNGAWIQEGRTAVTREDASARQVFVPMPVMDALLSAAREQGAAEERERIAEALADVDERHGPSNCAEDNFEAGWHSAVHAVRGALPGGAS